MIIAASRGDVLEITAEHLAFANEMVTKLEEDMPAVFSNIGISDSARQAEQLVAVVRSHGRIDRVELYRQAFGTMQYKEFTEILISAVAAGFVRQVQPANSKTIYIEYTDSRGGDNGIDLNATVG